MYVIANVVHKVILLEILSVATYNIHRRVPGSACR